MVVRRGNDFAFGDDRGRSIARQARLRTARAVGCAAREKIARAAAETRKPADFKSTHFLIHTDLPSKDAHELLRRLEVMLGLVAKYWGQPLNGTIEAYVVKDLANWPADSLDPAGRAKIETGAGITLVETLNQGRRTLAAKAVVYAVADHGTPQHEAVHAYCGQTFGRVGPLWYSEGMAEMGNYWRPNDASVRCPDYVIDYIRHSHPKSLAEILFEDGVDRPGRPVAATGDSWQNYAWRWALCQLLENNPNYSLAIPSVGLGLSHRAARQLCRQLRRDGRGAGLRVSVLREPSGLRAIGSICAAGTGTANSRTPRSRRWPRA